MTASLRCRKSPSGLGPHFKRRHRLEATLKKHCKTSAIPDRVKGLSLFPYLQALVLLMVLRETEHRWLVCRSAWLPVTKPSQVLSVVIRQLLPTIPFLRHADCWFTRTSSG